MFFREIFVLINEQEIRFKSTNPDKRDKYLEGLTLSHEILLLKTRNEFLRH